MISKRLSYDSLLKNGSKNYINHDNLIFLQIVKVYDLKLEQFIHL